MFVKFDDGIYSSLLRDNQCELEDGRLLSEINPKDIKEGLKCLALWKGDMWPAILQCVSGKIFPNIGTSWIKFIYF